MPRAAFKDMVRWVREKPASPKWTPTSSFHRARAPIIQIGDPNYTFLVKIAKSRLPSRAAR